MITDTLTPFEVKTNIVDAEQVDLTIDESSLTHIMNILIDLYKDRILAVIREYSTNALDAHVEAGNSDPIEVFTPSNFSHFLRIVDHGVGLSLIDIRNIYSKYGASTKRETNTAVGMLGLGCKSALTYTNQFTLVSVKDKVRVQAVISRDESGVGSITIVDESIVDESNGTEIIVPTKATDSYEFSEKAKKFFAFWEEGTVLVNGKPPEPLNKVQITDDIFIVKKTSRYHDPHSVVVMGNVSYRADISHSLSDDYSLVAYVPIGAVNFVPSREDLHMTDKTLTKLREIETTFTKGLENKAQSEISAASTRAEAVQIRNEWNKMLGQRKAYNYCGQPIPHAIKIPYGSAQAMSLSSHASRSSYKTEAIPMDLGNILLIENVNIKLTDIHRKKINKFLEDYPDSSIDSVVGFVRSIPKDPYMPRNVFVIDYQTIKDIRLPRNETTKYKLIAGSYRGYRRVNGAWIEKSQEIDAKNIDTTNPVFWDSSPLRRNASDIAEGLAKYLDDFTFVWFENYRKNKFLRNFPSAQNPREFLEKRASEWVRSVTEEMWLARSLKEKASVGLLRFIRSPELTKVQDLEFSKLVRYANIDLAAFFASLEVHKQWISPSVWDKIPELEIPAFEKKYPLLNWGTYGSVAPNMDHAILYMNMVHNLEKEN